MYFNISKKVLGDMVNLLKQVLKVHSIEVSY